MALIAGSKSERAAVVGISLVTGALVGVTDKKKPTWTTPVTVTGMVVGVGMMLAGKGIVSTLGEGIATGTAAMVGASIPGWMGLAASGTGQRVATPVRMASGGKVNYDWRQSQAMAPAV